MSDNLYDINLSLNQLENTNFDSNSAQISYITKRNEELRELRIIDLNDNDIRFLINQGEFHYCIISRAFDYLEEDLYREALYYEGDLLSALLDVSSLIWKNNPELEKRKNNLLTEEKLKSYEFVVDIINKELKEKIHNLN